MATGAEHPVATENRNERQKNSGSRNINMRVPSSTRNLIDDAAALVGKTVTEFVLESARKRAEDVLLDQRLFALDPEQYDAFMQVLDNPPAPNEKLKALLASKSPWEK